MEFKNLGIKCPNCGCIVIYERDKLSGYYISKNRHKAGEDDELYTLCGNKDCKLEFIVDTGLSEQEKTFVKSVLAKGHKKWWYVDRFIAGGSLSERSVIGADFLIHNLEGGVVWIEFKRHNKFAFTEAQDIRFRNSFDNRAVATRFVGLITVQKKGYENYNNHIHYWTPAFYRIIPRESFTSIKGEKSSEFKPKMSLNLAGLDQCIIRNVYTLERKPDESLFPLTNAEKNSLLQTPNFSLFNLTAGLLFRKGAYENIANEKAFEIIVMKLRATVNNRAEDVYWQQRRPYTEYKTVKITREIIRPTLKKKIMELVWDSYRPLFPIEITNAVQDGPKVKKFIVFDERKTPYIIEDEMKTPLRTIVKLTMEILLRAGKLSRIRTVGDRTYQYFPKGCVVIPLKISSSKYLDLLQKYVEIRLDQIGHDVRKSLLEIKNLPEFKQIIRSQFPITNPELAKVLQMDYNSLRRLFETQFRNELISNGLIKIEKRETIYEKDRRPTMIAKYVWMISLTDKGIEYTMKIGTFSR
ncbi:MAG: hypothetical protein HWN66_08490 [Candidatus Helarchaeota archaeon]|nr:hypothetical protein [Candidatus Helarchaeota archaeon]